MKKTEEKIIGEESYNKKPKSIKLINLLAIGIVTIIVVMIGAVLYLNFNSNSNNKETELKNSEEDNTIKKGEVELTYTSKKQIYIEEKNYFAVKEDNKRNIIDVDGNTVLENSYLTTYLGDGYFLEETSKGDKIIKDNEEIFTFTSSGKVAYNNNILYYIDVDSKYKYTIVAYDLKNKNELWRTETDLAIDLCFEGNYIKTKMLKIEVFDGDRNYVYSKIIDLNGKTIAESTEDYKVYATPSQYYIKSKEKEYVQVYDLKNNKISEIPLKGENNIYWELQDVLSNGMYIIYKSEKIDSKLVLTYRLYNINSELIKESALIREDRKSNSKGTIVVTREGDLLLKNDGTGIIGEGYKIALGSGSYDRTVEEFVILEKSHQEKDIIVNMNNEKTMERPTGYNKDSFGQSPNGKYIILYDNNSNNSCVYDGDFNKLYESSNWVNEINDEFVLEKDSETEQLYIINVFTGEKNAIDIKGEYYNNNESGIITQDGENYYLYAIR